MTMIANKNSTSNSGNADNANNPHQSMMSDEDGSLKTMSQRYNNNTSSSSSSSFTTAGGTTSTASTTCPTLTSSSSSYKEASEWMTRTQKEMILLKGRLLQSRIQISIAMNSLYSTGAVPMTNNVCDDEGEDLDADQDHADGNSSSSTSSSDNIM